MHKFKRVRGQVCELPGLSDGSHPLIAVLDVFCAQLQSFLVVVIERDSEVILEDKGKTKLNIFSDINMDVKFVQKQKLAELIGAHAHIYMHMNMCTKEWKQEILREVSWEVHCEAFVDSVL